MRKLFVVLLLIAASVPVVGQSRFTLVRRDLDGFFSLRLPSGLGEPRSIADVDGGYFDFKRMNIRYTYWLYENTPNFMRDVEGRYSSKPDTSCPRKTRRTRTSRTTIDGLAAYITECVDPSRGQGFERILKMTLPKARVRSEDVRGDGVFNLSVAYDDPKLRAAALQIARSVKFRRR